MKEWTYKEFNCKLKEVNNGVFRLYVNGNDIIGAPYNCDNASSAESRIEEHVDTMVLDEKLDELLSSSEHFKPKGDWWEIDKELADEYEGPTIRNTVGRRYAYYADSGQIKETVYATAPYQFGSDTWLKGERFNTIDEFRSYVQDSYGISL